MAYQATHWAWELDLPTAQKFTLVALADMADESFTCYPGQDRLARMIGASIDTVQRALKALESATLLTRQERRREDGYRTSDRYQLLVGNSPRKLQGDASLTPQPAEPHTANGPDLTPHGAGVITSKNHQTESPDISASVNAPAQNIDDAFDVFWSLYPIRKGKKPARAAFEKALKRAPLDQILAGLEGYRRSLGPGFDPSKVKWAQGWLNDNRWEDEHSTAPAGVATSRQAQTLALLGQMRDQEGDARVEGRVRQPAALGAGRR